MKMLKNILSHHVKDSEKIFFGSIPLSRSAQKVKDFFFDGDPIKLHEKSFSSFCVILGRLKNIDI